MHNSVHIGIGVESERQVRALQPASSVYILGNNAGGPFAWQIVIDVKVFAKNFGEASDGVGACLSQLNLRFELEPVLLLVICLRQMTPVADYRRCHSRTGGQKNKQPTQDCRSEEHTSELQSLRHL